MPDARANNRTRLSSFSATDGDVARTSPKLDPSVENPCQECHSGNRDDAKFCQSCGVALFEPCPSCNFSTRVGQTFCVGCGFNLLAEVNKRLHAAEEKLAEAKQAIEQFEFDRARDLLRPLIALKDNRPLAGIKREADELVADLSQRRTDWNEKLQTLGAAAAAAAQRLDHAKVIATLESVPQGLITDVLQKLIKRSRQSLDKIQQLRQDLKAAIKAKDYVSVGYLVESLTSLLPGDAELETLSNQVSGVLLKTASTCLGSSRYGDAFTNLAAIPSAQRDSQEYQKLKNIIDDAVWITDQIARYPFATRNLGLLSKRLGLMIPADQRIANVVKEIAVKFKSGSADPLSLYPYWTGQSVGWGNVPVTIAGKMTRIAWGSQAELVQNPTRYMVSIGLALHAIGEHNFGGYPVQTKGFASLITRLGRKLPPTAWGIDCGTSGVRGIRLERVNDGYKIADVIWMPIDAASRARNAESSDAASERQLSMEHVAGLSEVAKRIGSESIPVWANLPSRDVLGKFFTLPPLATKQLTPLLECELATQFPLPPDQLAAASGITGTDISGSPRGSIVACKKTTVQLREKTFVEAGIKIAGLMPDPIALHHYVRYEWQDLIAANEQSDQKAKAIAVIDSGASGSTLYVGTAAGFWFRHHGFGGDDLTSAIAGFCNLTRQQAEAARIEPAKLANLAPAMEAMENRITAFSFRLSQSVSLALQSFGDIELRHVFCTGGTSLHHGWTRFAISNDLPST